ncbi:flavin reductase family protein [Streptomyces sp. NBC_00564]|uniref:flavin reductase family protein n=1 Tax=Streptomyces sp. NBC_00564 TaxID=2903663 RepID=UPI00352ED08D|nr:flavin reductase family protein [Streptomyces sp. NBC_00564]
MHVRFDMDVTYDGEDSPPGAAMNSFTSVSAEAPLVLIRVTRRARRHDRLPREPTNPLAWIECDPGRSYYRGDHTLAVVQVTDLRHRDGESGDADG